MSGRQGKRDCLAKARWWQTRPTTSSPSQPERCTPKFGINAVLARYVESPLRATLVSFVVGALVLLAAALVVARGLPVSERLGGAPWWVWTGGFLGAFYVLGSVVTAPRLGAATFVALILAGHRPPRSPSTTSGSSASRKTRSRPGASSGSGSWRRASCSSAFFRARGKQGL